MTSLSKKIECAMYKELKKSNATPVDGITAASQAYAEFLVIVGTALNQPNPREFAKDIIMQLASQI